MYNDDNNDATRRALLLAGLATAVLAPRPALAELVRLCTNDPAVSNLAAPLTIDTHAHFFNGSDLQIKEFLSQTTVGPDSELYPLVRGMGGVLQTLAWHIAPSAQAEMVAIAKYAQRLRDCEGSDQMRHVAGGAYQEGYTLGRRELQLAANTLNQAPTGAAVLGTGSDTVGLGAAIADLPQTYDAFEERRTNSATVLGSRPTFLGYIQFVLHQFNYRHVNAIDYLTTYSKGSSRKIDLVVASMVDYDWWLARGRPTPTVLSDQIDVMAQISVLLGGRVHSFAPFCPFREAMTRDASGTGEGQSLQQVKRAIETCGFIGVKLYPPMGFAPWGNSGKTVWQGKPSLVPEAANPDFGKKLDAAMHSLFSYCVTNDIPIMAHTNHSNGPYEDFKDLAGSSYWKLALEKFPGLRVSFGHFGDTDPEDHKGDRTKLFLQLMTEGVGTPGANTFADSGYFAGTLINQGKMRDLLRTLYAAENRILRERLMYGTDWTMVLPQQNVDRYLSDFMDVMRRVEEAEPALAARQTTLSNAFFGRNAVEFLGLRTGRGNRARLENFYARNKMIEPDWMRKVEAS
jgi:predicted TIM-barrel fold metal-dependent hydrolase